jgi:hypothetical protein
VGARVGQRSAPPLGAARLRSSRVVGATLLRTPDEQTDPGNLLWKRFERLTQVVNEDALNLRIAMHLLGTRVGDTGPTEAERDSGQIPVLEWLIEAGVERATEQMVVAIWSAFEIYVEDVFVLLCMAGAIADEDLPNVRIRIVEFMALNDEERWRRVWNNAEKTDKKDKSAVRHYELVLENLGIKVNIQPGRIEPLNRGMDGGAAGRALRELEAVRNVLVHHDGRVDRRLARLRPDRYPLGERVDLTDEAMYEFGWSVHAYCGALGEAAERALASAPRPPG